MTRSGYVTVDVDVDDVLGQMTDEQVLSYFSREQLLGYLGFVNADVDAMIVVADPVKRLEIITALRAEGYTVEPG